MSLTIRLLTNTVAGVKKSMKLNFIHEYRPCEYSKTDHVLQRYTLLDAIRKIVWPHDTALTTKLHSCRQELEKTASFIASTGVIVQLRMQRRISE